MAEGTNKFKELFCEEATDQLATLSNGLLELEKNPGEVERYSTLMRAAHTIKGAAATMGYAEMAKLAHALEDVLHLGERGAIALGANEVSVSLHAVDSLRASLERIKADDKEADVDQEVERLKSLLVPESVKSDGASPVPKATIERVAQLSSTLPASVKVDVNRLDVLMGLFEDMLMLRLKLDSLLEPATNITHAIADHDLKQRLYFIKEFESLFAQLARLLSETQEQLLVIRLVPIETVFSQFPRMVRDLSLRESKSVKFDMEGDGVELDRTVLGGLGGAIAHLLRNAVDHGIVKEGRIALSAKHVNDRVHVSVEDDGAGIDYERVKSVAIERGVIDSSLASQMRKQDVIELLFHPNMSTNTEVTDISGRGVGLSAVKEFAQEVGGHVVVVSPTREPTGGTRFTLDLPISLATVQVLLVTASRSTFALPFSSVERTMTFSVDSITKSAHQDLVEVEGGMVPLLYLNRLLDISFADVFFTAKKTEKTVLAALVRIDGERFLLAIDDCLGEYELLVKSLPPILRNIRGFSGSALLPDGRTVLMLDAQGLLLKAQGDILGTTR